MKIRSHCPINYTLEHFGDKWSFLIIRDLMFKGKRHYNEFLEAGENLSTSVLGDRLRKLGEVGIISRVERQHLLILDDFGLQSLDSPNRPALLEIIEDRHGKGSVVITSQVHVNDWYEIIGEKTVADAIMDRLVHDAHMIELMDESMRKTRKKPTENEIEIRN